jgi:hypothetical protein
MNEQIILQKIANTLVINTQRISNLGILEGKMGIALFLYHYARYSSKETYAGFADTILDRVYDLIHTSMSFDFASGLSGIAWGIDYLIKNKFVEGDVNEILEDIDERFLANINNTTKIPVSDGDYLYGYGFYFLLRTAKDNHNAISSQAATVLQKLLENCSKQIEADKKELSLSFFNSILYLLLQLNNISEISEYRQALLKKIIMLVPKTLTDWLCDYTDLKTFLHFIDLLEVKIDWMNEVVIYENKRLQTFDPVDEFIKNTWQKLLYANSFPDLNIPKAEVINFINGKMDNMTKQDLIINGGLSGCGLGLILE